MAISRSILVILLAAAAPAATVTDHYDFKMSLLVPRIYNNTESQGTRKYQRQHLAGEMTIIYDTTAFERPTVAVTNLINRTHKISGECITYSCTVNDMMVFPRVNLIGSNKTDFFNKSSIVFYLDAEPSYSVGPDDEDNSLLITLAGAGSTANRGGVRVISTVKGSVAGTLGCGCKAYGHVSPTRVSGWYGPTEEVDDVASVYGTWTAKWKKRERVISK